MEEDRLAGICHWRYRRPARMSKTRQCAKTMEETGYQNMQFTGRLGGVIHARFYQNGQEGKPSGATFEPVMLELKDGTRKEIAEAEKALHDLVWLSPREFEAFITHPDMKIVFDRVKGVASGGECFAGEGLLVNSGKIRRHAGRKRRGAPS